MDLRSQKNRAAIGGNGELGILLLDLRIFQGFYFILLVKQVSLSGRDYYYYLSDRFFEWLE
jgi:hypothetical protein